MWCLVCLNFYHYKIVLSLFPPRHPENQTKKQKTPRKNQQYFIIMKKYDK